MVYCLPSPHGTRAASRPAPSRRAPVPRLVLVAALFAGLAATSRAAEPDPVESVEKAAGEWVKVRAETARLTTEWAQQQQLLESMVNGLTERAKNLEEKRAYLEAKTAKDREEIAKLTAENQASTTTMTGIDTHLQELDARLLQLRPALPPRLSAALDLPYRSLAGKELAVGERMQLSMTILNRCIQFNRGITSEEEVLNPTGAGNGQLLDVIYWGLSHAYALDRSTGATWFGSPGPAGWQWEPLPDGAKPVGRLIAIYHGKGEPDFVAIPARLKSAAVETTGK